MPYFPKDPTAPPVEKAPVNVWDLPTRLFHWILVLLVVTSFVTANIGGNAMQYHVWSGETILALLLFRLIWGFIGSGTVRFTLFVRGPAAAWRYARSLLGPDAERHLGHNPLGGWSIVAMLLALGFQAVSGLFATDDIATQGPLYPLVSDATAARVTDLHQFNAGVIITLVCLHIVAILFYLLVKKENLVKPMITGHKLWQGPLDPKMTDVQPSWLALIMAAVCIAGIFYWLR